MLASLLTKAAIANDLTYGSDLYKGGTKRTVKRSDPRLTDEFRGFYALQAAKLEGTTATGEAYKAAERRFHKTLWTKFEAS